MKTEDGAEPEPDPAGPGGCAVRPSDSQQTATASNSHVSDLQPQEISRDSGVVRRLQLRCPPVNICPEKRFDPPIRDVLLFPGALSAAAET